MPEYPPPYTPWNLPPRRTRVDNYPVSVIEEYATAVVRLTVPSTVWNPTGPHAELELLDLRDFLLNSHRGTTKPPTSSVTWYGATSANTPAHPMAAGGSCSHSAWPPPYCASWPGR